MMDLFSSLVRGGIEVEMEWRWTEFIRRQGLQQSLFGR